MSAGALHWQPAVVPGTAAAAVGVDGRDFDAEDWWFRASFAAIPVPDGGRVVLELGGIATVAEVFVNGEPVLESQSMWRSHEVDLTGRLLDSNDLAIVCRALGPLLAKRRRPAARWRTRVVNHGNLRWFRTMMFGRSPGFAPGPAPVGPWRPVALRAVEPVAVELLAVRAELQGGDGVIRVRARARGGPRRGELVSGRHRGELSLDERGWLQGELRVPDAERWWPHTHGDPVLHEVALELDGQRVATRRVGFRALEWAPDISVDGLELEVNGVPVFARGAVWTPMDLVTMAPEAAELRALLEQVRDAGMNMLRVVGTGAYESPEFHDLCDELGIMVWQDLMFANLDYPVSDPAFRSEVEAEARQVGEALIGRPSLTVICGNSEVEQQAAMLGLEPDLGRDEFWERTLPAIFAELGSDCPYVPSTPCGGVLPFHPQQGISHYFGVSGYFRAPEDARRAGVRFAAECLAFANVPDEVDFPVHHPRWKAGVVRDAGTGWDIGSGWDFDDVRDHYLRLLFGVDPVALRRYDHDGYLQLSRFASAEVMAEVIGEWRRAGSPCRGALVLWLKDLVAGAGLGVFDHRGEPKVALHYLRRAFAPVAVWATDEGVGGVVAHVANDRPERLSARLRVALYRDWEEALDVVERDLDLAPHVAEAHNVEELLGRFVDPAWAYRFGPPAQDLIVLSLESQGGTLLSQSFFMPAGHPPGRLSVDQLGLEAMVLGNGQTPHLRVTSRRFAYGVRVAVPGFRPADDAFSVEPGHAREVELRPQGDAKEPRGAVTALNLRGSVPLAERWSA